MTISKRIDYIDFIKGVCIFIVVWGHSIQNMGHGEDFWTNPIHQFVCAFHMPIFMLLSGFFFSKSAHKPLFPSLLHRFQQLIIPCFGWSIVLVVIHTSYLITDGESLSTISILKSIVTETLTRFWFLRSVFICFTLAIVSLRIFKRDKTAFVISFLLFLLLPDNGRLHLDKFMYPFFWMGYFIHKHLDILLRHRTWIMISSLTIFAFLLLFYTKESYIYVTGMSLYDFKHSQLVCYAPGVRLPIILHRYLVGAAGSLGFFLLLQLLYRPSLCIIQRWGTYTLGIYTIHILIEGNVLQHCNWSETGFFIFNFLLTPIVSILLIELCISIIKIIEKNELSSRLFLGKRKA